MAVYGVCTGPGACFPRMSGMSVPNANVQNDQVVARIEQELPMHEWCETRGFVPNYTRPGKSNQNAFVQETLRQVREITRVWIIEYNEERQPRKKISCYVPTADRERQKL